MNLKKENETLESAASELLAAALRAGAEKAEVCATYGQKSKITLEKQDFHLASSDYGYDFGLRVLKGEKQGFASGNTIELRPLKELAVTAVELAGFAPKNPLNQILPSPSISRDAPSDLWDTQIAGLSIQTQKEWAKKLAEIATSDKRFRLNEGSVEVSCGSFLVMNSTGTHRIEKDASISWGIMGMGVDGENITSFDYYSGMSRKWQGALEKMVHSIRHFCKQTLDCLEHGRAENYRGPVIFSPRAVTDIFLGALVHHLNARAIVESISRWTLDDRGKPILNAQVTLKDNPWLADRRGWTSFDREGTPTSPKVLIEKGAPETFLFDNYAATALKAQSTGHAVGGPTSLPTVSPHCLQLMPGTRKLSELMSGLKQPYLVVHRFSGQTDPVTGDFSGVAKGADWMVNGERAYSVKETLISGNIFECFGSALIGLSQETEVIFDSSEAPYLLADGVSVTAGAHS